MHRPRSQAGFTLFEVLVAFIVVALALGVMFGGVLGGMRSAAVATHTQEALAIARSRLAAAAGAIHGGGTPEPRAQGDEGSGFRWTVQVSAAGSATLARKASLLGETGGAPLATLYRITVAVAWALDGGPRSVRLDGAATVFQPLPRT